MARWAFRACTGLAFTLFIFTLLRLCDIFAYANVKRSIHPPNTSVKAYMKKFSGG
jgi:hypothetical protein